MLQIINGKRVLLRHYGNISTHTHTPTHKKRYHQKDLLARRKFPFHYSFNVFKFLCKSFLMPSNKCGTWNNV